MSENGQSHLSVREANLSFGGIRALKEVSFDVAESEILAIIGPNGAGKTSLLNAINGFYRLDSGKIIFQDQEISSIASHKVPKLGIARTFQSPALYSGLEGARMLGSGKIDIGWLNPSALATMAYLGKGPFRRPRPIKALAVFPSCDRLVIAVSKKLNLQSM